MITETAAAVTPEIFDDDDTVAIVWADGTYDIVAIVWADGTFTTAAGTFAGGRREAKAAVRKATV